MITVLASCDLERAAQTNWLNTACPICLSRNCVHTEKKKKNMRILEHKQTNNNPTTMNKKLTFRKFFS